MKACHVSNFSPSFWMKKPSLTTVIPHLHVFSIFQWVVLLLPNFFCGCIYTIASESNRHKHIVQLPPFIKHYSQNFRTSPFDEMFFQLKLSLFKWHLVSLSSTWSSSSSAYFCRLNSFSVPSRSSLRRWASCLAALISSLSFCSRFTFSTSTVRCSSWAICNLWTQRGTRDVN